MKKNIFMMFVVAFFLSAAGFVLAQANQPGQPPMPPANPAQGQRPMMGQGQNPGQGQPPAMNQNQGQKQGPKQDMGPNTGQKKGEKAQPGQKKGEGPKDNQGQNGQPAMMDNGQMQENPNMFGATTMGSSTRERIAHPGEIGNYEQITKSGNAMYGVRKPGIPRPNMIDASKAPCVKTAIGNRATTARTALLARQQAMLAAMDARTACELAALDKTTAQDQASANQACIDADKKAVEAANTLFETAKNNAQATFQNDVRTCLGLPQPQTPPEPASSTSTAPISGN
ncbi:MAG: hypothetical protein WCO55_04580 [Candidatus Falkowbacteria bacterium]